MNVKKISWCDKAHQKLKVALMGDDQILKHEVDKGICELWEIHGGESYLITRVEVDELKNKELVFVAGSGHGSLEIIEHFKQQVKKHGVKTMRLHSNLKGMKRLIAPLGFEPVETIYKVSI